MVQKVKSSGPVLTCNDFFMMIREFECIIRNKVNQQTLSADSLNRFKLTEAIFEAFMIHHFWDRLRTANPAIKDILLETIVKNF